MYIENCIFQSNLQEKGEMRKSVRGETNINRNAEEQEHENNTKLAY